MRFNFNRSISRSIPFFVGILFLCTLYVHAEDIAIPDSLSKDAPENKQRSKTEVAFGYDIEEITPFVAGVHGMAVNDEGILYFSDTYSRLNETSKVYALEPPFTGKPVPTAITGRSVAGLLWHEEKLYVAFLNKDQIVIYDKNLEFLESRIVDSPLAFATDGNYVFVVTYFGDIGVITNNNVRMFVEDFGYPFDLKFTGKESLWLSQRAAEKSSGKLLEIGLNGEVLDTVFSEIKSPHGLMVDENQQLYVADKDAGRLFLITPDGEVKLITDRYSAPICITENLDGRILVNTDHNEGTLLIIRPPR